MVSGQPATTPRVATRRVSRFSPRPFSSPLAAVRNVGRPPVVLEWGSTVLRVGYAEQSKPQHIIVTIPPPSSKKRTSTSTDSAWQVEEESQCYLVVSALLRQVFDRLMVDPTTRRVVIVGPPYPLRAWQVAVKESLWNLGVPAVAFLSSLEAVPVALGWKRGLVVHVGNDESHFLAHVDGLPLPFTYQAVPTGYKTAVEDASKITTTWDDQTMENAWLNPHDPNSLLVALFKCLEACPLDARKDVVNNIVVCGDTAVLVPDLARRLAAKLQQVLRMSEEEEKSSKDPTTTAPDNLPLTMVPVGTKQLKALADHVGVLSCAPYRPDLICWVGASIHATLWHRQDDASPAPWVFSPTTSSE